MIDFTEFVGEVYGTTPYPWQVEFARRCRAGTSPAWVAAPTGAGKTMAVDALVWALAAQAELPAAQRTASRRIVWAIDRRILVDEVAEQAERLARRLARAAADAGDPLREVALALLEIRGVGSEERPLEVERWRGGLDTKRQLRSPCQPQVITSTVAQIGSRLLFRGYGVGAGSLAVAAGMAACDTTICLDEAHLVEPFRQTVASIAAERSGDRLTLEIAPLRLITLTATPPGEADDVLGIGDEDRRALGSRWNGSKTAELREPDGSPAPHIVQAVRELVERSHEVIACVVNRVSTARTVERVLRRELVAKGVADVMLLIGPQRPIDRAQQFALHGDVLFRRATPSRPLIVVATQTIEVGLDADFSGMVTQSASASALLQRLGRLNRTGEPRRGFVGGEAIIVRDTSDGLYTLDEPPAWAWLSSRRGENERVDVSVSATSAGEPWPRDRVVDSAPVLRPHIVDQLAQTRPTPAPLDDPDIEPFLRGTTSRPAADVQIVWRCDLRFSDGKDGDERRRRLLQLAPPDRGEQLTLSLRNARAFLSDRFSNSPRRIDLDEVDVEGGGRAETDPVTPRRADFVVLRGTSVLAGTLRHPTGAGGVDLAGIRPGDVVVVGSELGGLEDSGGSGVWCDDVAPDLHPISTAEEHVRPIRLSIDVIQTLARQGHGAPSGVGASNLWFAAARALHRLARAGREAQPLEGVPAKETTVAPSLLVDALPETLRSHWGPMLEQGRAWMVRVVDPVAGPDDIDLSDDGDDGVFDSAGWEAAQLASWVLLPILPSTPRDALPRGTGRSASNRVPTIEEHCRAVEDRVTIFASSLGLDGQVVDSLRLAARAHDLGKLDPRMQAYFAGGIRRFGEPPLAKSLFGTRDPRADEIARRHSGWPRGLRHELASVAILASHLEMNGLPPDLPRADPTLALHLVATHHGYGRPIPPLPATGPAAPPERFPVDALGLTGWATGDGIDGWQDGVAFQRFFHLVATAGAWTLAYLEALLVLADRTVSAEGR